MENVKEAQPCWGQADIASEVAKSQNRCLLFFWGWFVLCSTLVSTQLPLTETCWQTGSKRVTQVFYCKRGPYCIHALSACEHLNLSLWLWHVSGSSCTKRRCVIKMIWWITCRKVVSVCALSWVSPCVSADFKGVSGNLCVCQCRAQ